MKKRITRILVLAFSVTGCTLPGKSMGPVQDVTGDKVVCILAEESRFKTEVVKKLSASITQKGFTVVTGSRKKSKYYKAHDYGAVIYMAELWAWHTPRHAIRYFKKNNMARNTVFMITAGDPDVVIKKPFDAVTSASKSDSAERVSGEIMEKLNSILGK